MNFKTTSVLLEVLKPYTENSSIDISTNSASWYSTNGNSDIITIDAKNHIGFEVFENEIITFFFTDHYHFEDYTSELHDNEENYIERAKIFLKELFENKIRHVEYYKGKTLSSEKYYIIFHDGRKDECIGNTWFGLSKFINPFSKKTIHSTTWQFDKSKGFFTTRDPKNIDKNTIEVIDINEDCYIEIFKKHNSYIYNVIEINFDEYYGRYYWAPAANIIPSGLYDSKDSAIKYAIESLKIRDNSKAL